MLARESCWGLKAGTAEIENFPICKVPADFKLNGSPACCIPPLSLSVAGRVSLENMTRACFSLKRASSPSRQCCNVAHTGCVPRLAG